MHKQRNTSLQADGMSFTDHSSLEKTGTGDTNFLLCLRKCRATGLGCGVDGEDAGDNPRSLLSLGTTWDSGAAAQAVTGRLVREVSGQLVSTSCRATESGRLPLAKASGVTSAGSWPETCLVSPS